MYNELSGKKLLKILLIITLIYLIFQAIIYLNNDTSLSRLFWIEHKNVKELIDAGLPEKSEITSIIKFISDQHFWLLRAGVLITLFSAFYYKDKNKDLYILLSNITISVILVLLISSGIVTWILKIFVGKPRPYTKIDDYIPFALSTRFHSFPSGHTTETFSYIIPYIYFIKKYYILIILLLYGILVTLTRVILSYHFLTDVLFGIYITAIIGYIICYLVEHNRNKPRPNKDK